MNTNSSQAVADTAPAFANEAQCQRWLSALPAGGNAVLVQAQLLRQLGLFNRHDLPGGERLAVLELLRPVIHSVQEECARKFIGRPLPLAPPEQAAFDANRALWHALTHAYSLCLGATRLGRSQIALACQRALATLATAQLDSYRGGFQPDGSHWHVVHRMYAHAEAAGVAAEPVADAVRLGKNPGSPSAAYVESMLLHVASPHELAPRQLGWTARWARRWAGKVGVLAAAPAADAPGVPLHVDVDGDGPAAHAAAAGPGARWLETSNLRRSLKKRLTLLDGGQSPGALQLGEDCQQPACGQLLRQMYQRWCKGGVGRRHERHAGLGACFVVSDFEAIHYYAAGRKPFKQPGVSNMDMLRREREEIATFGRVPTRQMEDFSRQHGYVVEEWQVLETWRVVDESATGLHVLRPPTQGGGRLAPGQLVAVRPGDGKNLLLGIVRWVALGLPGPVVGALQAGVHVFPGQPQPVAVRNTGLNAVNEKYTAAFVLPAVAALKEPATLVTPTGWFKLERVVELFGERPRQARFAKLVERGSDFERSVFSYITE